MSIFKAVVIAGLIAIVYTEANAATPLPTNSSIAAASVGVSVGDTSATGGGGGMGGAGGVGLGGAGGVGLGGAASNDGNSQSTTYEQVRQSPGVFMNAPAPTAPCQASRGGFLSFIAGAGIAYTETLEECEIRETSRIAHGVGQAQIAKEVLCMGKYARLTAACRGSE